MIWLNKLTRVSVWVSQYHSGIVKIYFPGAANSLIPCCTSQALTDWHLNYEKVTLASIARLILFHIMHMSWELANFGNISRRKGKTTLMRWKLVGCHYSQRCREHSRIQVHRTHRGRLSLLCMHWESQRRGWCSHKVVVACSFPPMEGMLQE